jgi:endoglucanase
MKKFFFFFSILLLIQGCFAANEAFHANDAFFYNKQLSKTINFGNALEMNKEGGDADDMVIEKEFFRVVREAGFSSVRIPIKWSGNSNEKAPFKIDKNFFDRVDQVLGQGLAQGLNIILDFHHYDELYKKPHENLNRWISLWQQVAEHYKYAPDSVYFELLNEPHDSLTDNLWNDYLIKGLTEIRKTNPNRVIIVGSGSWNAIDKLSKLELPESDDNLIVTFHYYSPYTFTHSGADWGDNRPPGNAVWKSNHLSLSSDWDRAGSWDTEIKPHINGIEIKYKKQYAGLKLESKSVLTGYDELSFSTTEPTKLSILCGEDENMNLEEEVKTEYLIPLSKCGGEKGIKLVQIENTSAKSQASFVLENLKLLAKDKQFSFYSRTEAETIKASFNEAVKWSQKNNRPLFMGEFGAYNMADIESRIRWTKFVRREAEKHQFSWAYWEFGAGFGVYNREKMSWHSDLLKVLIP